MRKVRSIKKWTDSYNKVESAVEDLVVLNDFFKEGEATEEEVVKQFNSCLALVEDLESRNMLRNEEDALGAVLKINSGAGGTES